MLFMVFSRFMSRKTLLCLRRQICVSKDYVASREANLSRKTMFRFYDDFLIYFGCKDPMSRDRRYIMLWLYLIVL